MKIAIVAGFFPKISETFVLDHITGMIDLGHDVCIVADAPADERTAHPSIAQYDLEERVIYTDQIVPKNRFKRFCLGFYFILSNIFIQPGRILNALNFFKYGKKAASLTYLFYYKFFKSMDIIHCHFGTTADYWICLKDVLVESKFFVTFHGSDIRKGFQRGVSYYHDVFNRADGVISISDFNTKGLIELGCPEAKIINLPNGIDLDKFQPKPRKNTSNFTLTTVARLVEEKNLFYALQIVKRLNETTPKKFSYRIIGDGPLKENLSQMIKIYGLEGMVKLLGGQSQQKIIEYLNETDVFLLPSRHEAFCVALLEAQAMEVPVVACDVGGVASAMVDQETGCLIPLNDTDYAIKVIDQLFDDKVLRNRMGKDGRHFVEQNFDIRNINRKLEQIYSRMGR
ncbi:MAG: glycosyltransferase [Candidatus Omnitrophica bacterium]|nr:glycosyltransferase [Candidatus Omnitrophota bacterium]